MVKSKAFNAKKMNYSHSLPSSTLIKPTRKAKYPKTKLNLKVSSWLNALAPLLLFIAFFISLYIAILLGAKLAYFTSFPMSDDSAWMRPVQNTEIIIPKIISTSFEV